MSQNTLHLPFPPSSFTKQVHTSIHTHTRTHKSTLTEERTQQEPRCPPSNAHRLRKVKLLSTGKHFQSVREEKKKGTITVDAWKNKQTQNKSKRRGLKFQGAFTIAYLENALSLSHFLWPRSLLVGEVNKKPERRRVHDQLDLWAAAAWTGGLVLSAALSFDNAAPATRQQSRE